MKAKWNPLGPITAEIEKVYMDRLETAGGYVAAMARSLVPVGKDIYSKGKLIHRSGALRRTIRVVRLKGDPNLTIWVMAGVKDLIVYARMVEYGGVHNRPAKPYLRPALAAMRGRIKSILDGGA